MKRIFIPLYPFLLLFVNSCVTVHQNVEQKERWNGRYSKIMKMAEYSELAYKNDQTIKDSVGGTRVEAQNAVFFYKWSDDKKRLDISVRGTTTPQDVRADIDIQPTGVNSNKHHRGFKRYADSIRKYLNEKGFIRDMEVYKTKVYLTGHSLGGATAAILAMDLDLHFLSLEKDKRPDVPSLVTFGQPKTSTDPGAIHQNLGKNFIRVVNCDDPVPFLPPGKKLSHFGDSYILFDSQRVDDQGPAKDDKRTLLQQVEYAVENRVAFENFGAGHKMTRYTERLRTLKDNQTFVLFDFEEHENCVNSGITLKEDIPFYSHFWHGVRRLWDNLHPF